MRPPNQRPGTSVRWLLLSWAALFIMSLLIPLVTGAGVFGMILFLAVFLLTAVLCLLLWGVARLWRRGRSRICNCLRIVALLLLFCAAAFVFVGGGATTIRFAADNGQLPLQDRYLAVIIPDGANLHQAEELLMKGIDDETQYATTISRNLPNISRYFINEGAFTANGISVWPSSSIPAHTGIMTGSYPRRTGVMGQRQFRPSGPRHISYIGLGILELSRQLSKQVKTLCEYFPRVRSLVVLQIVHRGCSLYVPTPVDDELVVTCASQVINATAFLGKYSGGPRIPRIVVMTLPSIDHETHNAPLDDQRSVATYLRVDKLVGDIIELYKRKGIYDKTLFVLCSDHGMENVHHHLTIDNLMHDLRFEVFQSLKWTMVPAWGSFEANFYVARKDKFARVYDAVSLWGGNSDALVYVKGQRKDAQGNVVEKSWAIRPTDEMLKDYHVGGTNVNIIQRLIDYSPGIGLIFTNPEHHVFNVYSKAGQGQFTEREANGTTEFRYVIVAGQDPLGYTNNPAIGPHVRSGSWLTDQQWIELTYLEHYPDGLKRVANSFENENSAAMHIVASDGWDFAPYYVAKHVLSGSHGSLNLHASLVPIMFHGPGIKHIELPYGRTVDILPTILKYFNVEATSMDGRALPIFEDAQKNHQIMNARDNVFSARQFEDQAYIYVLEHIYASYDRRIVRIDKNTSERETLVESAKKALPELLAQANASLELIDFQGGKLILRITYAEQDREGETIAFDVNQRQFE